MSIESWPKTLGLSWENPEANREAPSSYVIQWRLETESSYDTTRSETVSASQRLYHEGIYPLDPDTSYMVRLSALDSRGRTLGRVETAAQTVSVKNYVETEIVTPLETDFPWLRQAADVEVTYEETDPEQPVVCRRVGGECTCEEHWSTDYPISFADRGIFLYEYTPEATPSGNTWPGLIEGSSIKVTVGRHKLLYPMVHELAHHFTLDHRVGGNPMAVAAGWLYFQHRLEGANPERCTALEVYADTLANLVVPTEGVYLLGCPATSVPPTSADQAVARSISSLQVPQWFYDTYSTDGTDAGVNLVDLWADVKNLDLPAVATYGFRDSFGGFCSEKEAIDAVASNSEAVHNPWVDGGCNNRRPQNLTAAPGANTGEIDVTWAAPLWATDPDIDEYVVQWKTGAGTYNNTDSATVTDLTDLTHTITGLTSGSEYTVRVAAINSSDQTPLTDDDNRDRTAETTGTAK